MKKIKTTLNDAFLIKPKIFGDDRGYFTEIFKQEFFNDINFIQDNQSFSEEVGILRGMHLQKGESAQSKLIRVLNGKILDVIVDLRPNSSTFLKHEKFVLDTITKKSLFVPKGFAHGFLVLEPNTLVLYKVDNPYDPKSDVSIKYNDVELNIDWDFKDSIIQSTKDQNAITLKEYLNE